MGALSVFRVAPDPRVFGPEVAQHSLFFDASPPAESREAEPELSQGAKSRPVAATSTGLEVGLRDDPVHPWLVLPRSLEPAVDKRKAEFLAGRWCARSALQAAGARDAALEIGPDGEPLWPEGFVGSITHSHGFASAAVARADQFRGLGLDAEPWASEQTAEATSRRLASAAELVELVRATGWSRARTLTVVFSAKESIYKCLFPEVRRVFDFRDVELTAIEAGGFSARLCVALGSSLPAGFQLNGRFEQDETRVVTAVALRPQGRAD